MLDLKFIRANPDVVRDGVRKKQVDVGVVDRVLKLDDKRRKLLVKIEGLRSKQNKASQEIAQARGKAKDKLINQMKKIADEAKESAPGLEKMEESLRKLMLLIPNLPQEGVPEGKDETENVVLRKWGEPKKFDFKPLDHLDLGTKLDLIDIERATKTSGARFYYLTGDAVKLEFALVQFAIDFLSQEGFTPVVPPVLVKERIMESGGYLPQGEEEIYKTVRDNLHLVGTSEQSILGMYADEILLADKLPLRYVGFSSCFRREAGSYGKDTRGIFRVHQFDKVEMFSFCHPDKSSEEHEYFLSLEEKIMQKLELPYQVVVMCTGDLGAPAAKKYDIEAWMPAQSKYRETHSTSNCTDFQARRLKIRYRAKPEASPQFVHTLNGTAIAIGRMIIAILENYQQKDGSVTIPQVLQPYMGGKKQIKTQNAKGKTTT